MPYNTNLISKCKDSKKERNKEQHIHSLLIIFFSLTVVLTAWTAVYLVDVLNILERELQRDLWWHLFRNRGPIEWVQWAFLTLTSLGGAVFCGIYWERGKKEERNFWALLSLSFILMMIEDAGDPRHVLADIGLNIFGISRHYIEGVVFFLIIMPLAIAIIKYLRIILESLQARVYFFTGILLYALAASASLFRDLENFYVIVGEKASSLLTGSAIPGFFLMDFLLEESIELMGAAFFFAWNVFYWKNKVF